MTWNCLLISENLPTFDCSCMVGNTELFLFWLLDPQNNFMFPTMQEQSKVGKKSEINKQFHVKSWLTYRSYRSVWYLFSCKSGNFGEKSRVKAGAWKLKCFFINYFKSLWLDGQQWSMTEMVTFHAKIHLGAVHKSCHHLLGLKGSNNQEKLIIHKPKVK